jgi:DNA-binding NarL/FixJ family response regulator
MTVLNGKKYISTSLAEKFYIESELLNKKINLHENLSDREFEVFRHLVKNKTITKISEILSLSVKTISTYKSRVFKKLHLKDIDDLKKYADDHNLFRY